MIKNDNWFTGMISLVTELISDITWYHWHQEISRYHSTGTWNWPIAERIRPKDLLSPLGSRICCWFALVSRPTFLFQAVVALVPHRAPPKRAHKDVVSERFGLKDSHWKQIINDAVNSIAIAAIRNPATHTSTAHYYPQTTTHTQHTHIHTRAHTHTHTRTHTHTNTRTNPATLRASE